MKASNSIQAFHYCGSGSGTDRADFNSSCGIGVELRRVGEENETGEIRLADAAGS
jgi:hypothetical protein